MRKFYGVFLLSVLLAAPALGAVAGESATEVRGQGVVLERRAPLAEATRSLVVPGWAQQRMGEETRSLVYGSLAAVTLPFAVGLLDLPFFDEEFGRTLAPLFYGVVATMASLDAYHLATEWNRENGWELGAGPSRDPGIRIVFYQKEF